MKDDIQGWFVFWFPEDGLPSQWDLILFRPLRSLGLPLDLGRAASGPQRMPIGSVRTSLQAMGQAAAPTAKFLPKIFRAKNRARMCQPTPQRFWCLSCCWLWSLCESSFCGIRGQIWTFTVTVRRNTALRRKLKTTKTWTARIVVSPAIELFIDNKHFGERLILHLSDMSLQESEPEPPEPPPSLQDILEVHWDDPGSRKHHKPQLNYAELLDPYRSMMCVSHGKHHQPSKSRISQSAFVSGLDKHPLLWTESFCRPCWWMKAATLSTNSTLSTPQITWTKHFFKGSHVMWSEFPWHLLLLMEMNYDKVCPSWLSNISFTSSLPDVTSMLLLIISCVEVTARCLC